MPEDPNFENETADRLEAGFSDAIHVLASASQCRVVFFRKKYGGERFLAWILLKGSERSSTSTSRELINDT